MSQLWIFGVYELLRTWRQRLQDVRRIEALRLAVQAHHAALPYQELPAFLCALRKADAGEVVRLALEFTILCAARTSETLNTTWAEVDLEAKTWTIPGIRMKAGLAHRVPLSPRCVTILERAKALSDGGPYVFPGRSPKKPLSNMVFLMGAATHGAPQRDRARFPVHVQRLGR